MHIQALHRRGFLALGGATAAGVLLGACGEDDPDATAPSAANDTSGQQQQSEADVTLDFSDTVAVVNYAYALEQLEAAFYKTVTESPYQNITDRERRIFEDIYAHENVHAQLLQELLGDQAIAALEPDFSQVDFDSRDSVLQTAQTFENLGVGAYNGAASYIDVGGPLGTTPLEAAGDIVSVEARHASVIGAIIDAGRSGSFAVDAFDKALPPSEVLQAAQPFIKQQIAVRNA